MNASARRTRIEQVEDHTFLPALLQPGMAVLDLGANRGRFSTELAARFGCHCYALEPTPELAKNISQSDMIRVFPFAVAAKSGRCWFQIDPIDCESSRLVASGADEGLIEVEAVHLEMFVRDHVAEPIALIKVDIEGSEIAVLDSLSDDFLRQVGQLTVEFHDFNGWVLKEEVLRVRRRLRGLGFVDIVFTGRSHYDTLFVHRTAGANRLELMYIRWVVRNAMAARRVLSRMIRC